MSETAPSSMIQLTYSSIPVGLGDDDIEQILVTSRRNNRERKVTGMLLVGGGRILQVLEGPVDVVDALYTRIEEDPRHSDCRVLLRRNITARDFTQWTMGYAKVTREQLSRMPGFVDFFAPDFDARAFKQEGGLPRFVLLAFRESGGA